MLVAVPMMLLWAATPRGEHAHRGCHIMQGSPTTDFVAFAQSIPPGAGVDGVAAFVAVFGIGVLRPCTAALPTHHRSEHRVMRCVRRLSPLSACAAPRAAGRNAAVRTHPMSRFRAMRWWRSRCASGGCSARG
jgi:hypothetical protein